MTLNKKTEILIIDDERGSLELIASALEDFGYSVFKSANPLEGLKIASEKLPALIVLDWYMPNMDGLQVLKKLKEEKLTKEIPVIMATGIKTESKDLKQALDAGAVDFIRKPIDEIELEARVKAALNLVHYYNESRDYLDTIHRQEKQIINQKADEYKRELERKKNELIANALRLLKNIESTTAMIEELSELNKNMSEDNSGNLRNIISKYQSNTFQTQWDEFERQFEDVHTEFYQKLLHDFPLLTVNERKLCIYIKMDMKNKDIAALTFCSHDAVRKARSRLKFKFGLAAENDLTKFLNRY